METKEKLHFYYNDQVQDNDWLNFVDKISAYFGEDNYYLCDQFSAQENHDLNAAEWWEDTYYAGDELASITLRITDPKEVEERNQAFQEEYDRGSIRAFYIGLAGVA
jgi:hypothetical protein